MLNLGLIENQYFTTLFMNETVLPFEWHSFCISIDIARQRGVLVHNDHIQVIQLFNDVETETEDNLKFMTSGHLGGTKFEGAIANFEVFSRPLSDEEIMQWTLCQIEVKNSNCIVLRLLLKFENKLLNL